MEKWCNILFLQRKWPRQAEFRTTMLGFANLRTLSEILETFLPTPKNMEQYLSPIKFTGFEDYLETSGHNSRYSGKHRSRVKYVWPNTECELDLSRSSGNSEPGPRPSFTSWQNEKTKYECSNCTPCIKSSIFIKCSLSHFSGIKMPFFYKIG